MRPPRRAAKSTSWSCGHVPLGPRPGPLGGPCPASGHGDGRMGTRVTPGALAHPGPGSGTPHARRGARHRLTHPIASLIRRRPCCSPCRLGSRRHNIAIRMCRSRANMQTDTSSMLHTCTLLAADCLTRCLPNVDCLTLQLPEPLPARWPVLSCTCTFINDQLHEIRNPAPCGCQETCTANCGRAPSHAGLGQAQTHDVATAPRRPSPPREALSCRTWI